MKRKNNQKGNVLIITTMLFLMISVSISVGLYLPIVTSYRNAQNDVKSKKSYAFSESGVEDVVYRLQNNMNVSSTETLVLGTETATTVISDVNSSKKQIKSLADTSGLQRTVSATISKSSGTSFNYGIQVGQGGLYLNSGIINGNVYSNGPITASSSGMNSISGSAVSANSPALVADQSNGVTGTPSSSIKFGNAAATEDIAQSFTVTNEYPLNKIQFYIKKVGSPANSTVMIVSDNGGVPGTNYLASGTLSASLVGASYGWVDVVFTTNPILQIGVTYWIVTNASTSASNYYVVGANTGGYSGVAKIGKYSGTWNATSPSNLDTYFNLFIGGFLGSITGINQWNQLHIGTGGIGSAQAHTVTAVNAIGSITCATGTFNNKTCLTGSDPVSSTWPVSDSNIDAWKAEALAGGTTTGNITTSYAGSLNGAAGNTFGPKKIVGNFHAASGWVAYITGTLWITGDLTIDGGTLMQLSSTFGVNSGVIIVDGKVIITGGGHATGSGTTGSYIMIVSTSDCPTSSSCGGANAIAVSGGSGAVVLVAQNGTIDVGTGAVAKELTGYKINVTGGSSINYETGLSNMSFTSGPSGSWVINSWQEVSQ